jgi:prepilin-type N-terminal cleavage/methylation domain-containing protein
MRHTLHPRALRGFTLIELLVVIAIIGILAAIVLASLGTARSKGNDAAVKSEMHQLRSAADLYLNSHALSYGTSVGTAGSCSDTAGFLGAAAGNGSLMWGDTVSGMKGPMLAIFNYVGGLTKMDCGTNGSAWSVAVQLPTGAVWCVDYNGTAKGTQGSGTTAYTGGTNGVYGAATAAHTAAGATTCN